MRIALVGHVLLAVMSLLACSSEDAPSSPAASADAWFLATK